MIFRKKLMLRLLLRRREHRRHSGRGRQRGGGGGPADLPDVRGWSDTSPGGVVEGSPFLRSRLSTLLGVRRRGLRERSRHIRTLENVYNQFYIYVAGCSILAVKSFVVPVYLSLSSNYFLHRKSQNCAKT